MKSLSKMSFEEVAQEFAPKETKMILEVLRESELGWSRVYVRDDVFKQWFEETQCELTQEEIDEIQQEVYEEVYGYKDISWEKEQIWEYYDRCEFYTKVSDVFGIDAETIEKVLSLYGEEFYQNVATYASIWWFGGDISIESVVMIFGRYLGYYYDGQAKS